MMELIKSNSRLRSVHISRVTLASDDISDVSDDVSKTTHTFQYKLNDNKTRRKIYEGAFRTPYVRENKKTCINLIFSDGAFKEIVLKAITDLKDGPTHFYVNNEEVEKIAIDPRTELTGKHIDTKIHFRVNGSKIVIHVYNSKQKLTVQGSKFEWFVDHYLEPFFKDKIDKNISRIEQVNEDVRTALNQGKKKNTKVDDTKFLDENSEIIHYNTL